ncbi:MAG TPA: DUF3566 domain-containing protein [Acidimicrobiales bacterium]|nr:DUF3566 domain-containing protein [Acidimicrobiales bacterium]
MSENPVRSESESRAGGGWGAPLKGDFGPADLRRPGLLFDSLLARGSRRAGPSSLATPPLGPPVAWPDGISARSAAVPVGVPVTPLRRAPGRGRPAPAPAPQVRTVTHLDVRSVAKVSAVFYTIVLIVMVVASILLWVVADAAGAVHSIDHSVQSLFGVKHYVLHPGTIAMYSCAAGAVVAMTGTLLNVLAATVYNLIAEVVGGIRLKVSDS